LPRITPQSWRTLVKLFEKDGFTHVRQASSHHVMEKDGVSRPVIIPEYANIDINIISGLLRTAGMSRDRYFELLAQV